MIVWNDIQDWDIPSHSWQAIMNGDNYMCHYYYENYGTSSVIEVKPAGEAHIFPVPATDLLNIDLRWNEAQSSQAVLYDLSGRKLAEWPLPNTQTYQGYIPTGDLSQGTYILHIVGTKAELQKVFSVQR